MYLGTGVKAGILRLLQIDDDIRPHVLFHVYSACLGVVQERAHVHGAFCYLSHPVTSLPVLEHNSNVQPDSRGRTLMPLRGRTI